MARNGKSDFRRLLRNYATGDPLNCSRPLLFKNPQFPEFPLSLGASSFLASLRNTLFVVTALHALNNSSRGWDEVSVNKHLDIGMTQDKDRYLNIVDYFEDPSVDLAILQTDTPPKEIVKIEPLAVLILDAEPSLSPMFPHLVVRGYPRGLSEIHDDQRVIEHQPVITDAEYIDQDQHRPGYHKIKFTRIEGSVVQSINDMSGSPVFQYRNEGETTHHNFAGVLVEGSAESMFGHFVDGMSLWKLLAKSTDPKN